MADLTLNISQYSPLQQFTVRPWETFSPDDQLAITDKINLIVQTLNRLGKLSNDVVTDWNKVMTWVSNDGMTAEVDSQLQKWKDDGTLTTLINAYTGIGDLTTLQTVAKDSLVNAINENVSHLADKVTKINPLRAPFNVIGNANYYKTSNSTWYQDSAFTILANDDTNAIRSYLSYMQTNYPYQPILFPTKNYLITSTITIPQECKYIDFGYSYFNYQGASGTACLSTGSPDGVTGSYLYADFRNLIIQCDQNKTNICHGFDLQRLRSSFLSNITVWNANYGFLMGDSWSTTLFECKPFWCNIGIVTGRSSNGVNISHCEIDNCTLGIEIGNGRSNGYYVGVNGLTLDSQTQIQNCVTAIQLYYIKNVSVTNCYFENNTTYIDIPNLNNNTLSVDNFVFDNNICDMGSGTNHEFMLIHDNTRAINFTLNKNEFIGIPVNTFLNRDTGVTGNFKHIDMTNNTFTNITSFVQIFPNTFPIQHVRTDFLYSCTIASANWTVMQPVNIQCLGNYQFEITGAVSRVNGTTSTILVASIPYNMGTDNYTVSSSPVFQTANGSGGSTNKTARLEIPSATKQVNIFTLDNTDLNNIFLNARWCTR